MIPAPFIVVLDANVLFPFTLRDTLLRAAAANLYQLRWSAEILDEMERSLVKAGHATAEKAKRLREAMTDAFPEAEVTGYEPLISSMSNQEGPRTRGAPHATAKASMTFICILSVASAGRFTMTPTGFRILTRPT